MSRLRAMVLLCATFLGACEGCHERRRICLAPSSSAEAPPLEALSEEVTAAIWRCDETDARPSTLVRPEPFAATVFSARR